MTATGAVEPEVSPDLASLDADGLARRLRERPSRIWICWALAAAVMLAMQLHSFFSWPPERQKPRCAEVGLLFYGAAGAVFVLLSALALRADSRCEPRYRLNQSLLIGCVALTIAAGLPWPVFLWGPDGAGRSLSLIYVFWPFFLCMPLAYPPRLPRQAVLDKHARGELPFFRQDLSELVGSVRLLRGERDFPVRLAVLAQASFPLGIGLSLFGPYALGWALPMPHAPALLFGAALLAAFSTALAWRVAGRLRGSPQRMWATALAYLGVAVGGWLFFTTSFPVSPQPDQRSLLPVAGYLLMTQAVFLATLREIPPLRAKSAQPQ
ncbi:hypothetical protein [Segniliparus rugosus]|uniref:Uncharacterized protein n=1 Tax=Segniliparus rugosus (strain ATCC BAA-974 / DSM 45345 / CCUG 50838 / CIP 108380 / JCM 13579 / CDC 945) TaxID=679197 RepID=E5XSV7_SEGRC|nr:hypothetical protein [Segniliparus rugosus]EFV12573.1 hypothetical protein HMPREF9336_02579 [Segniliparus rugosus ATCC BAA-974]